VPSVQEAARREDHERPSVPGPADDIASVPVTSTEVKQLWWFFDGSIMTTFVRRRLWKSWGFCSRHTWAHSAVEHELRYQPHGTVVLYEDLLGRAATALTPRVGGRRRLARRFAARDECLTCAYITVARTAVEASFHERAERARRLSRTRVLVGDTRQEWQPRACPCCLRGDGPVCRPHLLRGADPPDGWATLTTQLDEVLGRLRRYGRSMRWRGPDAGDADRSALIETLGWFAGWRTPAAIVGLASTPADVGGLGWAS
jgi:hypothetical protein